MWFKNMKLDLELCFIYLEVVIIFVKLSFNVLGWGFVGKESLFGLLYDIYKKSNWSWVVYYIIIELFLEFSFCFLFFFNYWY